MTHALFAASLDPVTNGHVHVIAKAANTFDKVTVVIASNPAKQGCFTIAERIRLCVDAFKNLKNVSVEAVQDQYMVDYAKRINATHLVRGLPTVADFQYEYELYHNNRQINPAIDTVFVMCDKDVQQVRSSTVRGMVGYRHWLDRVRLLVPPAVLTALLERQMELEWHKLGPKISMDPTNVFNIGWHHLKTNLSRPYHNLAHILTMLDALADHEDAHGTLPDNARRWFILAIWLHDLFVSSDNDATVSELVMLPISPDASPEEQSAQYAGWFINLGRASHQRPETQLVQDLIMSTDYSKPRDRTDLQKLFACLDCLVLGSDPLTYSSYAEAIKREYDGPQFYQGRQTFLSKQLEPSGELRTFFGHPLFAKYIQQATDNMLHELEFNCL